MISSSPASPLDVQLQPGRPPMIWAAAAERSAGLGSPAPGRAARRGHPARVGVGPWPRTARRGPGRRGVPGDRRRPDGRAGGLRAAAAVRGRPVLLGEVAVEPADVHAPRAELHRRVPGPDAVRVPGRARCGRGDRSGRLTHRARRAAAGPGRTVRTAGLAAGTQLQRGDRGVGRPRRSAPTTPVPSRATAAPTPSRSNGSPTGDCARGSGATPWWPTRRPASAAGSTRSRS